jgi:hypothetical protein
MMRSKPVGTSGFTVAHSQADRVFRAGTANADVTKVNLPTTVYSGLGLDIFPKPPSTYAHIGDLDCRIAVDLVLDVDAIPAATVDFHVAYQDSPVRAPLESDAIMIGVQDNELFEVESIHASRAENMTYGGLLQAIAVENHHANGAIGLARDVHEVPAGTVLKAQYRFSAQTFQVNATLERNRDG